MWNLESFQQFDAQGITANSLSQSGEGIKLVGGNLAFLEKQGFVIPPLNISQGMLFAYGIIDNGEKKLCEVFELYDELKPYAKTLIESLHKSGIESALLSGDRQESVNLISNQLHIRQAKHALSPLQKAEWISTYKQTHKDSVLVMIGDGINDAPALNQSDIAISMGAGSDIAILSSDIVILDDKLSTLHNAFAIAQGTYKSIKQNIALSIGYNALSVPLALAGLVIPLFAALSMSLSSIIVVLNSLRLRNFKAFKENKNE